MKTLKSIIRFLINGAELKPNTKYTKLHSNL
jgi:hypothetical protein